MKFSYVCMCEEDGAVLLSITWIGLHLSIVCVCVCVRACVRACVVCGDLTFVALFEKL